MECKQCGGTGLIINNKYCRCKAGKMKKVMDDPRTQAKLNAVLSVAKTIAETTIDFPVEYKKPSKQPPIQVGDWVERDGLVCMVNEIAGEDVRVFSYRSVKGAEVNFKGWVNIATLKPMPLEGFEDYKTMAIDLALATEDAKWFKKVMKAGVNS